MCMQFRAKPNETVHEHFVTTGAFFTIGCSECFVHHCDNLFTTDKLMLTTPTMMFTTDKLMFTTDKLCSPPAMFTIQRLRRQQVLRRLRRQQALQRLHKQQRLQELRRQQELQRLRRLQRM